MVRLRSQSPRAADFSAACRAAFASLLAASSVAVGQLPDRVIGSTNPVTPIQKGNAYDQVATSPTPFRGSSHCVSTAPESWGLFTPKPYHYTWPAITGHTRGKTQDRLCLGAHTARWCKGTQGNYTHEFGVGRGSSAQPAYFPRSLFLPA